VFQTPHGALSVTCSIGIATFPDGGPDWDALFKAADEALYVSKRTGRNRCTAWSPRGEMRPSGVQGLKPDTSGHTRPLRPKKTG
jgi:predicted signal transduction protein with EAL and GGDEF domain